MSQPKDSQKCGQGSLDPWPDDRTLDAVEALLGRRGRLAWETGTAAIQDLADSGHTARARSLARRALAESNGGTPLTPEEDFELTEALSPLLKRVRERYEWCANHGPSELRPLARLQLKIYTARRAGRRPFEDWTDDELRRERYRLEDLADVGEGRPGRLKAIRREVETRRSVSARAMQQAENRETRRSAGDLRVSATTQERQLATWVARYARDHAKEFDAALRWLDRWHSDAALGKPPDIGSPFRRMMSAVNAILRRKSDWLEPNEALGFALPTGSDLAKLRIKAHRVLLVFWLISDPQSEWSGGPFEREGKDLMADRSCVWAMLRDDQRSRMYDIANRSLEILEPSREPRDLYLISAFEENVAEVLASAAGHRVLSSSTIADRVQKRNQMAKEGKQVRAAITAMQGRGWPIEATSSGYCIPPRKRHLLPPRFRRAADSPD